MFDGLLSSWDGISIDCLALKIVEEDGLVDSNWLIGGVEVE